jgi:hypothetical protein
MQGEARQGKARKTLEQGEEKNLGKTRRGEGRQLGNARRGEARLLGKARKGTYARQTG